MSVLVSEVIYNDNPQNPVNQDFVKLIANKVIYLVDGVLHMGGKPVLFKIIKPPDSDGNGAEYELNTEVGIPPKLTIVEGVLNG